MTHILTKIVKFDNFMLCGMKNPSYRRHTWVSPYEVAMDIHPLDTVDCLACKELYILEMLAEA
jgi:hypothetical protein